MGNKMRVERWRLNVPAEVESVYDAAMAAYRAEELDHEMHEALREACRQAEEVEHE